MGNKTQSLADVFSAILRLDNEEQRKEIIVFLANFFSRKERNSLLFFLESAYRSLSFMKEAKKDDYFKLIDLAKCLECILEETPKEEIEENAK